MTPAPDTRPDYEDDRNFATALARGLSVLRAFRTDDDGPVSYTHLTLPTTPYV